MKIRALKTGGLFLAALSLTFLTLLSGATEAFLKVRPMW